MTTLDAQNLLAEFPPTVAAALWQPERCLMLAVLEDAIHDCLVNVGAPRGIRLARFKEASDWFRSDDTGWPYSFVNICNACGLDAAVIRRQLGRCIRDLVLRPGPHDSWTGSLTLGGRTYTRPLSSIWSWRSVQSFESGAPARAAEA